MVSKFKQYLVTGEDTLSGECYSMRLNTTSWKCAMELSYGKAVDLGYTDNEMFWCVLHVEEV